MSADTKPTPAAPDHLSARSMALWREVIPRRARYTPERIAVVQTALEALDRADEARCARAAEGLVTTNETTAMKHIHPLLRVEKDARDAFLRACRALDFQWYTPIGGGGIR